MIRALMQAVLALAVMSALGCVSEAYYKTAGNNPASPDDKQLVFSLRTSSIQISKQPDAKPSDAKGGAGVEAATAIADACKAEKSGEAPKEWDKCLGGVGAKAVAKREPFKTYLADPAWGTTFTSATAVDTDPLMIKSLAVDYKNPAVTTLTGIGTGATAGFAIGGPWGAAVGGVVGGAASIAPTFGGPKVHKGKNTDWEALVCPDGPNDSPVAGLTQLPSKPALYLPLVLDPGLPESGPLPMCWHALSNREQSADLAIATDKKDEPLSGWVYRIKDDENLQKNQVSLPPVLFGPVDVKQLSEPFAARAAYFADSGKQSTFPVSACRAVVVEVTWWEQLEKACSVEGQECTPASVKVKSAAFHLQIADANYVQKIRLPKNGTISLLPTCGGYESSMQAANAAGAVIDEAVKQAAAIKAAQDKWENGKKK